MKRLITMLAMTATFIVLGNAFAGEIEKQYTLPGHGVISLQMPNTWVDHIQRASIGQPSTILFNPRAGEKFEIFFSPIWKRPGAAADFASAESVKKLVQTSAESAAAVALEKELPVKSLDGPLSGFYFSATDKSPKPEGYKYMTQGAVAVDGIVATFTILTDTKDSEATREALKMFANLKHSK